MQWKRAVSSWSGRDENSRFWASLAWGPGVVTVVTDALGRVVRVVLGQEPRVEGQAGGPAAEALFEVGEYLAGVRRHLRVPCLLPSRQTFTGLVLAELDRVVSYGQVATYGQVAAALGHPRAARAVGRAMAANPCPIFVPCHRVVSARGLGGYGPGLSWKKALLSLEGAQWVSGPAGRRARSSEPDP